MKFKKDFYIDSEKTDYIKCGLDKGHHGSHSWRGDLPGGPISK